ncbi:MAG TPA: hypothetical protein DCW52_13100 [Gammaproteobacteria bacterium]|jgi:small multidrug resistance pump|nr:hypothetical protein [Gammaproteobacteria bacterium]
MNAWTYLLIGIIFEVIGTSSIKLSNGFTHIPYVALCIVGFSGALYCVAMAVKTLEVSVVYAIWSGVGIALITMIGVVFFSESFNLRKLFYIGLIVAGVIGLKTSSDPIASLPDDNTTNF